MPNEDKTKITPQNYRSPFQLKKTSSYRIENKAEDTVIYLYDEIGGWGTPAEQIVKDIAAVKSGTLHIRINSPGGYVFDGVSIYNAIKQSKAKTVAHVDGLAASISSVIAMAADERLMGEGAYLMIHEPWSFVIGNSEDLRKEADLLDKIRDTIVKIYIDASGKEEDEIKGWMAEEKWFNANEAVDFGFASGIEQIEAKDSVKPNLFDLTVFKNVPDELREPKIDLTERDLEKALRDAGCSRSQAKEIMAKGFQPVRDAQDELIEPDVRDAQTVVDEPPLRDAEQPVVVEEEKAEIEKYDKVTALILKTKVATLKSYSA
jgi:ATP-dependent Clp protease, protease subunit